MQVRSEKNVNKRIQGPEGEEAGGRRQEAEGEAGEVQEV